MKWLTELTEKVGKFVLDPRAPSWCKSTLSQMAIAAVAAYLIVAAKIAWATGDLSGIKWAAEVFGAGYLAARKVGNGNPPAGGAPA